MKKGDNDGTATAAARTRLLLPLLLAPGAAVGLILVLPKVVRGAAVTKATLLAAQLGAAGGI